jgi:hypothetical protein
VVALPPMGCGRTLGGATNGNDRATCPFGSYDHDGEPATACVAWTECVNDEYVIIDPTAVTDRVCARCPSGSWSAGRNVDECLPDGASFSQLSLGGEHSCGVRASDGQAVCWAGPAGWDYSPPEGVAFRSLTAGGMYTCGVRDDDGAEVCWGDRARNLWQ